MHFVGCQLTNWLRSATENWYRVAFQSDNRFWPSFRAGLIRSSRSLADIGAKFLVDVGLQMLVIARYLNREFVDLSRLILCVLLSAALILSGTLNSPAESPYKSPYFSQSLTGFYALRPSITAVKPCRPELAYVGGHLLPPLPMATLQFTRHGQTVFHHSTKVFQPGHFAVGWDVRGPPSYGLA